MMNNIDEYFMAEALKLAHKASLQGEVPVGALVVLNNEIIGQGYNQKEAKHCPLAHAEMIAIKEAAFTLKNWRLLNTVLYSTLEPCIMCSGALLHARIAKVVFGAYDHKFGGLKSLYNLAYDVRLNHQCHVTAEIMADESRKLLKHFFAELRC